MHESKARLALLGDQPIAMALAKVGECWDLKYVTRSSLKLDAVDT